MEQRRMILIAIAAVVVIAVAAAAVWYAASDDDDDADVRYDWKASEVTSTIGTETADSGSAWLVLDAVLVNDGYSDGIPTMVMDMAAVLSHTPFAVYIATVAGEDITYDAGMTADMDGYAGTVLQVGESRTMEIVFQVPEGTQLSDVTDLRIGWARAESLTEAEEWDVDTERDTSLLTA